MWPPSIRGSVARIWLAVRGAAAAAAAEEAERVRARAREVSEPTKVEGLGPFPPLVVVVVGRGEEAEGPPPVEDALGPPAAAAAAAVEDRELEEGALPIAGEGQANWGGGVV